MKEIEDKIISALKREFSVTEETIETVGYNLLHLAVIADSEDLIKRLCEHEVGRESIIVADNKGRIPLFYASPKKYETFFKIFEEKKEDFKDTVVKAEFFRDKDGYTLLHSAASAGCLYAVEKIVEILGLDKVSEIMRSGNIKSPLYLACYNERTEIKEYFEEKFLGCGNSNQAEDQVDIENLYNIITQALTAQSLSFNRLDGFEFVHEQCLDNKNFESGKTYFLGAKEYYISKMITISNQDVTILGLPPTNNSSPSSIVYKKKFDNDAVSVTGSYFRMCNVTLKEEISGGDIYSLLSIRADNVVIDNCFFKKDLGYVVFFCGPLLRNGSDAIEGYYNNRLNKGNVFSNNTFESNSNVIKDNFSFSLQENGLVRNNKIDGKLAVYMCKNCVIEANSINSKANLKKSKIADNALHVSLPSENIIIFRNRIKAGGEYSCLKISEQLEHTLYSKYRNMFCVDYHRILIISNMFKGNASAIEMENAHSIHIRNSIFQVFQVREIPEKIESTSSQYKYECATLLST